MTSGGVIVGRLALITGAGSGIGRAVCQLFAREGANIALADCNQDGVQETLSSLPAGRHAGFEVDVASSQSVSGLMKAVRDEYSATPTIAINCAGITRDKYLINMTEKQFDEVINVNLKGSFLITQAIAQGLKQDKVRGGSIINISSIVGKMGNIGQANYASSKAGVVGLTKTAAKELAQFGIRCNAVLPGFIDTPMVKSVPEHFINLLPMIVPLGRMGTPEEVAEACLFLASDRSSYVTGVALEVTGGLSM